MADGAFPMTLDEQKRHYAEVKARLYGLKPKPVVIAKPDLPSLASMPCRTQIPKDKRAAWQVKYQMILEDIRIYHAKYASEAEEWRAKLLKQVEANIRVRQKKFADQTIRRRRPILDIIREVAAIYDVTIDDICGPRRAGFIVEARHAAMFAVSAERPDLGLIYLGQIFGNRDHTSVLHGIRAHAKRHGLSTPERHGQIIFAKREKSEHVGWKRVIRNPSI